MGPDRAGRGRRPRPPEAEVQHVVRTCAELGTPVVPRGAGTGLSGGANAVGGCVILDLAADGPGRRRSTRTTCGRGAAGRGQRRRQSRRGRARPVVPARPGQCPVVDDRRQRGHQRRRPVLPEVRRDPRLRARPARGRRRPGGLRRGGPPRPAHHQGRRRARPGRPVRRVGGHARRGDRGDAAAAARHRPARRARSSAAFADLVTAGQAVAPDHPARADPGRARTARPGLPGGGRGLEAPGYRGGRGGAAAGAGGHAGGLGCGRGRRHRRDHGRGRERYGSSSRPTTPRPRRCSTHGGWLTRRWSGSARS